MPPFSLCYASIDDAINLIYKAGQGTWLSKADISDAFKVMPLHPSQWHLFDVQWNDKLYFAVRLTFVSRSSPKIFDTLSEALCWILLNNCNLPFDFFLLDYPNDRQDYEINSLTKTLKKKTRSSPCRRKNMWSSSIHWILRYSTRQQPYAGISLSLSRNLTALEKSWEFNLVAPFLKGTYFDFWVTSTSRVIHFKALWSLQDC